MVRIRSRSLDADDVIAAAEQHDVRALFLFSDGLRTLKPFSEWVDREYVAVKINDRPNGKQRAVYLRRDADREGARALLERGLVRAGGATFGGQMRLLGHAIEPGEIRPGGSLTVTLGWEAVGPIAADYSVVTILKGRDGQPVEQNQRGLGGGGEGTAAWEAGRWVFRTSSLDLKRSLQPGEYTLAVGLYDSKARKLVPPDGAASGRRDGEPRHGPGAALMQSRTLSVPASFSVRVSSAPTWPAETVILGGILIVAAFMRLVRLSGTSGDLDEGIRGIQLLLMSAGYRPMQEIYSSQGPLLLDMLYPLYRLFGETLGAARLAIGVYSLFGIVGVYVAARAIGGPVGGTVAALLLTLSPNYLRNSRQALAEVPALAPATPGRRRRLRVSADRPLALADRLGAAARGGAAGQADHRGGGGADRAGGAARAARQPASR